MPLSENTAGSTCTDRGICIPRPPTVPNFEANLEILFSEEGTGTTLEMYEGALPLAKSNSSFFKALDILFDTMVL